MDPRIRLTLRVYAFAILGAFLLLAPWSALWAETARYYVGTRFGSAFASGWVRGAVSGLGLLDLLVAVAEARALWAALRPAADESVSAETRDA